MRNTKILAFVLACGLVLAVFAGMIGCAPAQAEQLEVTYYYLPG